MANVEILEEKVNTITKNPDKKEGRVARFIEEQTAKFPSDIFLWTSITSMVGSLTLKILKKDDMALFVGQWAAPLLILGVYNKLVKLAGHDSES